MFQDTPLERSKKSRAIIDSKRIIKIKDIIYPTLLKLAGTKVKYKIVRDNDLVKLDNHPVIIAANHTRFQDTPIVCKTLHETLGERGYMYTIDNRHVGMMGEGPIKEEGVVPKLMRKFPNLMGDLSDGTPCHMFSRDREFTAKFMTEFQDRLFFGTDMCFPGMNVPIMKFLDEMLESNMITKEVFDKITYKNAEKFLGVKL